MSSPSKLPRRVSALVCDFDGVFTDNKVLVMEDGTEGVICCRGDGMGIELLRNDKIPTVVISKEKNPVVTARCLKMNTECFQGIDNKASLLTQWAQQNNILLKNIVYVGNDINDIECLKIVGCAVVVADTHQDVLEFADIVLKTNGGHGAVREICDLIHEHITS
ncbi:KdsC family phosphatase [Thalassospira tepidiphila]|uniref:KdsC family phosphatase n=1 Tax=Thalassospira tepidiphila TaxID=393657 RepID=UPI003AA82656